VKLVDISGPKGEFSKAKINELGEGGGLYRSIIEFKKGYQPRTSIVKDEKSDLVVDPHSILARWRNHFTQLLNVHGVNDIRQMKYIQQSHQCPGPVPLSLTWLLKNCYVITHQLLIRFHQN
jgi:hypothetical protein